MSQFQARIPITGIARKAANAIHHGLMKMRASTRYSGQYKEAEGNGHSVPDGADKGLVLDLPRLEGGDLEHDEVQCGTKDKDRHGNKEEQ